MVLDSPRCSLDQRRSATTIGRPPTLRPAPTSAGWKGMITRPVPAPGYAAVLHNNEGDVKFAADRTARHHTEP
jgi:hypothetical protein